MAGFAVVVAIARLGLAGDTADAYFLAASAVALSSNVLGAGADAAIIGQGRVDVRWPIWVIATVASAAVLIALAVDGEVWLVAIPVCMLIQVRLAEHRSLRVWAGETIRPYVATAVRDLAVLLGLLVTVSASVLPWVLVLGCAAQLFVVNVRNRGQRSERAGPEAVRPEPISSPLMVGQAALVAAPLVDRLVIAQLMPEGSIVAYELYERVTYGMIVMGMGGLLSEMLRRWGRGSVQRAAREAQRLARLGLLSMPVVGLFALGLGPGVLLALYGVAAGPFSRSTVALAGVGATVVAIGSTLTRAMLTAPGGDRIVARTYVGMSVLNLIGDIALVGPFGISGIFAVTAIVHAVGAVVVYYHLVGLVSYEQ